MPTINFQGRETNALSLRLKTIKEEWNEYDLEDGTTLRMKAVVSDISRVEGFYDQENNPVYIVKASNIVVVNSPDSLKKKG